MKKALLLSVFLFGSSANLAYSQDHNHVPGHCEWCERNVERGLVRPEGEAELRNRIDMPVESSSVNLILLFVGMASVILALGASSYLKKEEKISNGQN
jgi:hypothetical protein